MLSRFLKARLHEGIYEADLIGFLNIIMHDDGSNIFIICNMFTDKDNGSIIK